MKKLKGGIIILINIAGAPFIIIGGAIIGGIAATILVYDACTATNHFDEKERFIKNIKDVMS